MARPKKSFFGLRDAIRTGDVGGDEVPRVRLKGGVTTVPPHVKLGAEFKVRRFEADAESAVIEAMPDRTRKQHRAKAEAWEAWKAKRRPYQCSRDGALTVLKGTIVDEGSLIRWKALRGTAPTTPFNNANAKLVVSSVTGTPAYTDVTVVNELGRKGMDTGFPLVDDDAPVGGVTPTARQFVLRSTFGSSDANGDWRRFWVVNHITPGSEDIFDNFSSSQGTKATGQVWELTITLTDT